MGGVHPPKRAAERSRGEEPASPTREADAERQAERAARAAQVPGAAAQALAFGRAAPPAPAPPPPRPPDAPPALRDALSSSGRPVDAAAAPALRGVFGDAVDRVRVHTGPASEAAAAAAGARAFALGTHVVLGRGEGSPGTSG